MLTLRADYSKNIGSIYSIFITFQYNPKYVALIKSMPKRAYDPNDHSWEIPYESYKEFINILNTYNIPYNGIQFMESISDLINRVNEEKAKEESEPELDMTVLDGVKFKTSPRDYQLEGIAYGVAHDKFLLADEQGLGKSLQALNIATITKSAKHCLVIVGYDILQSNWAMEVEKHTYESAYILGQREITRGERKGKFRKGNMKERIEDLQRLDDIEPYFIITSVATLRHCISIKHTNSKGKEVKDKRFIVAELIESLCQQGIIERVIMDESQVCKNISSDQTEALLLIKSAKYKIAATGTPLMNKHIDLYPLSVWLDKTKSNYWCFREKYCIMGGFKNKDIVGNKNGDILNRKLSKFMLRRKKDEVLDLPEKNEIIEVLDMDLKQENLYKKVQRETKQELAKMKGKSVVSILAAMVKSRQITTHAPWFDPKCDESVKFERTLQLMHEIAENGQKAIIFSNWSTPIKMLYNELSFYNPVMITGATKDRMDKVTEFQNNPDCKVILGTIGAMGTGVTLTAASNVIFLDEPWNAALKNQAIDRAHRIGTKNTVNIYTLICRDTWDEFVHKMVVSKGYTANNVVDGEELPENLQEILDNLLKF